ncbi:hypothetical protein V1283_000496 [Bradyrhizobium sp. AZCC 2262]|uniref:hypothetical protein n=1 Tax=Bradyrhizobium sp. AZCC 2262 TaxID=3117022 RepID=UPI002FF112D8
MTLRSKDPAMGPKNTSQNRLVKIWRLLIGGWSGKSEGGLNGWIIFGLHYSALLPRLLIAVAFFGLFAGLDSLFVWFKFTWLDWSCAQSLALLAVAGYASLLGLRFVVSIAESAELKDFCRAVAAMWLPIAVMALAAYLLFVNDQGRELGLGLMDTEVTWVTRVRTSALCLVLFYWALSAWLSARIGLSRTFEHPKKHQVLLFWGPRLVGVLAHFLAAWSLSCAALKDSEFTHTVPNVLLVLVAPSAILLAILFVWFLDHGVISRRNRSHAAQRASARRNMWVVVGLGVVFFSFLRWWPEPLPTGLLPGTLTISISAIVFLTLISWFRRRVPRGLDAQAEARISWKCGLTLAAIMFSGTVFIWFTPVGVGQLFGSLIIAFFAFGSFLVAANLLDLIAEAVAQDCKGRGFKAVHRRAVWCAFLGLLVLPGLLMSFRNYHRVRLCVPQCNVATDHNQRPKVAEAALAWYRQAKPVYDAIKPGEPVPLFIIATAGGGIRAAYWTATVLETLEKELGPEAIQHQYPDAGKAAADGLMRHLLFAISGVSGGSVGSAAYIAEVDDHAVNKSRPVQPTSYLKADLLAPGLASLAFIDIPSNFLPDFGQIDRGDALETGFESARTRKDDPGRLLSRSFLSFFPKLGAPQAEVTWRPAVLFNATHQGTGRRIITSNLKIDRDTFVDSYDALNLLGSDMRLSTAAHNSARFTYVSPAGNLIPATPPAGKPDPTDGKQLSFVDTLIAYPRKLYDWLTPNSNSHGFVIDGGYFDNYGAQTAFELASKAIEAIGKDKIRPVILQISSDPTMEVSTLVRQRCRRNGEDGEFLAAPPEEGRIVSLVNELSAPLKGIMSVRGAHGFAAVTSLAHLCCEDSSAASHPASIESGKAAPAATKRVFVHLAMCQAATNDKRKPINPPLGWALSKATRDKFEKLFERCDNDKELEKLKEALGVKSNEATQTEAYSNPKPDRS